MWVHYRVGRCSRTGHFLPIKVAQRRKATATVETVRYWRAA